MDDWAKRKLAELEAAAPKKRKKDNEPFARVTLEEAAKAFAAMNCPKAMVWLWLVHRARKIGNRTVNVTTQALKEYHVSRKSKYSALEQLEEDGLIAVEWRAKKNPVATLIDR
jgi:hypothetical protein